MPKESRNVISKWFASKGYETIEPMEFYRYMFPAGELAEYTDKPKSDEQNQVWKYNGVLLENTHRVRKVQRTDRNTGRKVDSEKAVWKNYIILDDLKRIEEAVNQFGKTESEFFIAPISYLGRRRTKKTERWLYACIIEVDYPIVETVDGHRVYKGLEQMVHDWTTSSMPYLMPSACVCSGNGVHLVYFLDRPYCLVDDYQKQQWDNFRIAFTNRIWNKYVTKAAVQQENHCQSFRVPGTRTKKGQRVEAFWISKKRYTIDELFSQVPLQNRPTWESFEECVANLNKYLTGTFYPDEMMKQEKEIMPKNERLLSSKLQEAKEKWPEWYEERVIKKMPKKEKGQWICHRGLYDWYFAEALKNPFVGSRYHRVHALAEYAVKCGIDYDEYKNDARQLYEVFKNLDKDNPFHWLEFVKARDEFFNGISIKSTRKWIENNTGVHMNPPAKRNGKKQNEHLILARGIRELKQKLGDNVSGGGRPSKQNIVREWQLQHPEGTKAECIRDTGLTKPTVYKWWIS